MNTFVLLFQPFCITAFLMLCKQPRGEAQLLWFTGMGSCSVYAWLCFFSLIVLFEEGFLGKGWHSFISFVTSWPLIFFWSMPIDIFLNKFHNYSVISATQISDKWSVFIQQLSNHIDHSKCLTLEPHLPKHTLKHTQSYTDTQIGRHLSKRKLELSPKKDQFETPKLPTQQNKNHKTKLL